ncbi:hypothetical protein [Flaviaesturariibacter amylovorans]|uniref:DUF1795 domain-containing protein n=1 Tax=Flaviaesturariibacter amylovorans TaxID=1084520 RepID=A0ABP8G8N2_9BACT
MRTPYLFCLLVLAACSGSPGGARKKAATSPPQQQLGHASRIIDRAAFRLYYPAAWTIDTADDDYDPDALFSIDVSNDNAMSMFFVFDTDIDEDLFVNEQVKEFRNQLLKKSTLTRFREWGRYRGTGVELKGRIMGVFPGRVRIFAHSGAESSFINVEQYFDSDSARVAPGMELIAASFLLKQP